MLPEHDRLWLPARPFIELAEDARLDKEGFVQDWIEAASLDRTGETAQGLAEFLQFHAVDEQLRGVPFYKPSEEGLYQDFPNTTRLLGLGFAEGSGIPIVLPVDTGNRHIAIWGQSGAGKTTLLRLITHQARKHCSVIVVEREKEDFRNMVRVGDFLVFDAQKSLVWNPPEVHAPLTPEQTITTLVAIFSKSFGLLIGSQSLLQKVLYEIFRERGIFDGSRNYPTLHDLRAKIASLNLRPYSRTGQSQDSLLNRLDGMLFESPRTYAYSKGFPVSQLANKSFVLEVKGLNEHHARFLVMHLLYTLFLYRIRTGDRGNFLKNLCIIDEARWLAVPGHNESLGFSPLSDVMAMSREAGIGLCLASQTANLDDSVFQNTRLKIAFKLGDGKDMRRVGQAMKLTKEQEDHVPRLKTGQCIVSTEGVEPFVMNVPHIRF
jgi:DNA helicase HerA-like ATPase